MNRRDMLRIYGLGVCAIAGSTLASGAAAASTLAKPTVVSLPWQLMLESAMTNIHTVPGSQDLAVITNAGAGELNGSDTMTYLDLIVEITGRSRGSKALFTIQTPVMETLWVGLFNRANGKLAFIKQVNDKPEMQIVNALYENITQPAAWKQVHSGLLGSRIFSVISIALAWQAGAPWRLLRAGELHNHICPGLSAGYILSEYVLKHRPLTKGQQYVFVGAPPFCANDTFQTIFDATMGKKGSFSMNINQKQLSKKYGSAFETGQFVFRLNKKNKTCDGILLNVNDDAVAIATGVTSDELSPKGGKKNPLFHITRLKRTVKLTEAPLELKLGFVRELDSFSNDMAAAQAIMGGNFDPYSFLST